MYSTVNTWICRYVCWLQVLLHQFFDEFSYGRTTGGGNDFEFQMKFLTDVCSEANVAYRYRTRLACRLLQRCRFW